MNTAISSQVDAAGTAPKKRHRRDATDLPDLKLNKARGTSYAWFGRRVQFGPYQTNEQKLKAKRRYSHACEVWDSCPKPAEGPKQLPADWESQAAQTIVQPGLMDVAELAMFWLDTRIDELSSKRAGRKQMPAAIAAAAVMKELFTGVPIADFDQFNINQLFNHLNDGKINGRSLETKIRVCLKCFRWAREEATEDFGVTDAVIAAVNGAARINRKKIEKAGVIKSKGLPGDLAKPKAKEALIEAVLQQLTPITRAMLWFAFFTGARPSEVCRLRAAALTPAVNQAHRTDYPAIQRMLDGQYGSGAVTCKAPAAAPDPAADPLAGWFIYEPLDEELNATHKMERFKRRQMMVNPRAYELLKPLIDSRPANKALFSPIENDKQVRARRLADRKTPRGSGRRNPRSSYVCPETGRRGMGGYRKAGCRCDGCQDQKQKDNARRREFQGAQRRGHYTATPPTADQAASPKPRRRGGSKLYGEEYKAGAFLQLVKRACIQANPYPPELDRIKGESLQDTADRIKANPNLERMKAAHDAEFVFTPIQLRKAALQRLRESANAEIAADQAGHDANINRKHYTTANMAGIIDADVIG